MTHSPWPWWLSTKTLAAAVCLGVLCRIYVAASLPVFPTVANTWDSHFYHETATALSQGQGYSFQGKPTAFFPPAFPFSLGAVYAVAGADSRAGQFFNVGLSLVLGVGAVLLARRLGGARAARWTCLMVALEPSQWLMPAFLMSEVLCGALVVWAVWWAMRARTVAGMAPAAVLGALAGMTRGHGFLVLPAALLVLWLLNPSRRRFYLRAFVLITLVAGLTVALWSMRNEARLGHPVLIATNAGINLWLGNNPNATGGRADPPGGVPQTGDEVRDEILARERAMAYMKEHPGRTLALVPVKAARLWAFGPAVTYRRELRAKLPHGQGLPAVLAAQGAHLLLLGLALWGAFRHRTSGVLWAVLAVWTLGHLPFLGGARYLFPVQMLLIIQAAAALSRSWRTGA